MIEPFLKAKHWQLFTVMIGAPFVFYLISKLGTPVVRKHGVKFSIHFILSLYFLSIVTFSIFFSWLWSIVSGLKNKVPMNLKLSDKKFKIFLWAPTICFSFILGLIITLIIFLKLEITPIFIQRLTDISVYAITISLFCIIYSIYFTSKTIKSVELQSEVTFDDFIIEFTALIFFPIGLWFIQPKINRLYENKTEKIQDIGKPDNNN